MVAGLNSSDPAARAAAAEAFSLGRWRQSAGPFLLPLLTDTDERVRRAAAYGIGYSRDHAISSRLHPLLDDESRAVRIAAIESLGVLRDEGAVPRLLAALEAPHGDERRNAAESLGQIADARAAGPLLQLARRGDPLVAVAAAEAAARSGGDEGVDILVGLLGHENWDIRSRAAVSLSRVGDSRAVERLISLLSDDRRQVRIDAAGALGSIRDRRAARPLESLLADEDAYLRGTVAGALGTIGDPGSLLPLLPLLQDPDDRTRNAAAQALRSMRDPGAVTALASVLDDPDRFVRRNAVFALAEIAHPDAVPSLAAVARDEGSDIRLEAVAALGAVGSAAAAAVLEDLLNDGSRDVRRKAAENLAKLEAHGPPSLARALQGSDGDARIAAVWGYERMGDDGEEALRGATTHEDQATGRAAAEALRRIEGRRRTTVGPVSVTPPSIYEPVSAGRRVADRITAPPTRARHVAAPFTASELAEAAQADEREATRVLEAAEKGDPAAQGRAAFLLRRGRGVKKDLAAAHRYAELSDGAGHPYGAFNLGYMAQFGLGTERRAETAEEHYRRALPGLQDLAAGGDTLAQTFLCYLHLSRTPLNVQDPGKAEKWCREASEGGERIATHNLAVIYQGHGPARFPHFRDPALLFEQAARANMPEAQNQLSLLIERGKVDGTFEEGMKWRFAAARGGYRDAWDSILHAALQKKDQELARRVFAEAPVEEGNVRGQLVRFLARAALSWPDVLPPLARDGADLDLRSPENTYTPLLLLIGAARPNQPGYEDRLKALRNLAGLGADIHAVDRMGKNPLYAARENEADEIEGFLLERGAGVNVPDRLGRLPVVEVVKNQGGPYYAVLRTLLSMGADPDLRDATGSSARDKAQELGHGAMVQILKEHTREP